MCLIRLFARIYIALFFIFAIADPASAAGNKNSGDGITILALGDSLTAGYGLDKGLSFPARLQVRLNEMGINVTIVNGGVSGDTSAGGLARISWLLNPRPHGVIVELGANDGLRGLNPAETRQNLEKLLSLLKKQTIPVLLTGMQAPPNLGRDYVDEFNKIYPDLAAKHHALYYPFFLQGVATNPSLNQKDGIHPNAKGVDIIVNEMLPTVARLIARIKQ